jgi:hypothetical protein
MSDIFAIVDIRYEILSYLDHYTLMRAGCCKGWMATAWLILSAVTHTDVMNFDYMKLCPNLTSISIGNMTPIYKQSYISSRFHNYSYSELVYLYKSIAKHTFSNIITIKCEYTSFPPICSLYRIFPGVKNISIDYDCQNYNDAGYPYVAVSCNKYPKIETLTIINANVYGGDIADAHLLCTTLVNCKIHAKVLVSTREELILQNCTFV